MTSVAVTRSKVLPQPRSRQNAQMKGEGVGLIDSFAPSQDLRRGQDCHLQCLKAPSSRSWPLEKSGLVPHGQTSKGSMAGRMWHRCCVSERLAASASSGRGGRRLFPGGSRSHAQWTSRWASERSGAEGSQEAGAQQPLPQAGEGTLWPLIPHPIPQFLSSWCLITGVRRVNSNLVKAEEWITFLP